MKMEIDYLEFWATRHCNLNCKGCSACAPIKKEPWFLNINSLRKDFFRLKELGLTINTLTVLGGEPLLHPNIIAIFDVMKEAYPIAVRYLITNGLLLLEKEESFWQYCRNNDIRFRITFFPVLTNLHREQIYNKLIDYKLNYHITDKKMFNKILVLNNKATYADIISNCGCNKAYNLYSGYIARCPVPFVVPDLNQYFNADFVTGGMLNIHEAKHGSEIMNFLETPNESCWNCSARICKVKWELASEKPVLSDWLV